MGVTCCCKYQYKTDSSLKFDPIHSSHEDIKAERKLSRSKVDIKNLSTTMSGYDPNKMIKQRATQKFKNTGAIEINNSQIKEFHSFMNKSRKDFLDESKMSRVQIFARDNKRFIKEQKDNKVKSTALAARPSNNLKVAPWYFRVERSGKIEDHYQTIDSIGKGGYGVVNKVRNIITSEIRAVKMIAKCKCQMSSSFSDEIRILQHIVVFRVKE
jgi:hypothetical protein